MSFKRSVIRELVRHGVVSVEEAKSLPTIPQLRSAYLACARQLAKQAKQETQDLKKKIGSLNGALKDVSDTAYNAATFVYASNLYYDTARALRDMSSEASNIYFDDLYSLIKHRSGKKAEATWSTDVGDIEYFSQLLAYLPTQVKAPFVRQAAIAAAG